MAEPTPPADPPRPPYERLVKFLPLITIGHLAIGLPTLFVSLALAYATYVQAEATHKMQQSSVWPYVSYGTSNIADGKPDITMTLANDGMGPARLMTFEARYGGKPMASGRELLRACCGADRGSRTSYQTSQANNVVLRPGDSLNVLLLPKDSSSAEVYTRFERERWKVEVRSCFCSIFDECWEANNRARQPVKVEQCRPVAVPFSG